MSKPCWEKGSAGAVVVVVVVVVVVGPARKKASDHGRTDQLEDRNIILNNKLILVSNDY